MNPEQQVAFDKAYPPEQFTQTTYSFSNSELRQISSLNTMVEMGQLAQVMISNVIGNTTLKRVGVKNSSDIGLQYNAETGEIYVKVPKFWCSLCQNKKAEFKFMDKVYCPTCIDAVKQQQVDKKVEEIKPRKKK